MALADDLTYWLAAVAAVRLKPSTLMSYEVMPNVYIAPALGRKKLNRLSLADIRLFLSNFKDGCLCCLRGRDTAWPEEERTCCAVGK